MEEEEKRLHRRSGFLLGLFALCLLFFVFILYDAQVVHREDYYAKSASQVTTTEGVMRQRLCRHVRRDSRPKRMRLMSNSENETSPPDTAKAMFPGE